jgi:hypothetical protein
VRRISVLFAESRVKRPSAPDDVGLRKRSERIRAERDVRDLREQIVAVSCSGCRPRESGLCGGHANLT